MVRLTLIFILVLFFLKTSAQTIGFAMIWQPFPNKEDKEAIYSNFEKIVLELCDRKGYKCTFLYDTLSYSNKVDTAYIINTCKEKKLDAIVFSKMLIEVVPTNITQDGREHVRSGHSYVEMVYYHKNGIRIMGAEQTSNGHYVYFKANQIKTFKESLTICTRRLLRLAKLELRLRRM